MSPAAGGAAPAQLAAAAVVAPAIAGQEPDCAAARRDPPGQVDGADPANAAARKTAWGVPAPNPAAAAAAAAAAANPGSVIIGGDASWPALVESKRGKSDLSDSLKSFSDGSGPSAQEDSIAASVPPRPVVEAKPISTGSNPTPKLPPNAAAASSSQQKGSTAQPNPVRGSGSYGGNNGGTCGNGSSRSRRAANGSGDGGSSGNGGDGNRNGGSLGSGSSCNSSNGDGSSNLNDNAPGSGTSGNSNGSSRNALGNNKWNNNIRSVGSRSSNGRGDGSNRNSGGSSNHWNYNSRNSNGSGGRSGYQGHRDHERGGNFSPRNYTRVSVMQYQQQPGVYQSGSFHGLPPPPTSHFMVPQQFVPYALPIAYHGDLQPYPLYLPPVEQFQNMHLVRTPMQPSWVPQGQPNLQEDIRMQIEFYFSTNNLCHDTFLRRHMNDQGWVPIDLILGFNRMRTFTGLVDTNYILDAIRGSESLEVQGNNVRRRNDWVEWLLH